MNSTLKQYYQQEWETDPHLTIEELARRYAFDPIDLGDTTDWKKANEPAELVPVTPEPKLPATQSESPIQTHITEFKTKAIKECLHRLKLANVMEVRELKDLVTTVDIIDKSLRTSSDSQNINVLIQNIVNKYGDDV